MAQWVAPHSIRWYGPGEHCSDPQDGDLFIVDHGTVLSRALILAARLFARLHPSLRPFAWCDHVAWLRNVNGVFFVSEMGPSGHKQRSLEHYQPRLYCVVSFDVPDEDRQRVCRADDRCSAVEYGWSNYVAQGFDGVTGLRVAGAAGDSMDCSAEVALCGWNVYWTLSRNPLACSPWDIAQAVGAKYPH